MASLVVVVSFPCRIHRGHTRLIDVLVQDVGVVLGPAVLVLAVFGAVVERIADVLVQVEHPEQALGQGVGVLVHPEVRGFARRVGVEAVFPVGEGRGPLEAPDLVEVPVAGGQLLHDELFAPVQEMSQGVYSEANGLKLQAVSRRLHPGMHVPHGALRTENCPLEPEPMAVNPAMTPALSAAVFKVP